jgi:hypothetical protein
MDSAAGTQIGPKCRTRALTGVAVHLTSAIAIIIPRPLMHAVADRRMVWMTTPIALPFVGVQPRAARRKVFGDQGTARPRVGVVPYPQALLARVARDDADDGGPIVDIGAVAFPLIGAPPGRIRGVAMRCAFFPPRSGTARRLRRQCPPLQPSVPSH